MTEAAIILGCQQERPDCQRELVIRFSPMLMTVARRYAADDHAARDILQDAFMAVIQNIRHYQATGSFEAWLRRIVVTTALKRMDKAAFKREQNGFLQLPDTLVEPEVYSQLGAEQLMALIQQLPDGYRQIFNLSVIEGYCHEEIAELLSISPASSRSQLSRARRRLQEMISQQEKTSYVTGQV
jgi:RNA polymerase sigma-70 factor (ECF subfamily)